MLHLMSLNWAFLLLSHTNLVEAAVNVPEIDPGSAMSGLAMLAGSVAVLRARYTKKSNLLKEEEK